MKEIKFRVWCKDYNEWEKDYCFLSQDGVVHQMMKNGQIRAIRPENHVIQFFVGLYDCNNKPIYDGDILKYQDCFLSERHIVAVEWISENDGWDYTGWKLVDSYDQYGTIEVIGNIFENPELLK